MAAICHVWLLSTENVISATKNLKFNTLIKNLIVFIKIYHSKFNLAMCGSWLPYWQHNGVPYSIQTEWEDKEHLVF
jgi:hypothetical protein